MSPEAPRSSDPPPASPPSRAAATAVLVHLSGARRGLSERLEGDEIRVGAGPGVDLKVSPEPSVAPHHATLRRRDGAWEMGAEEGRLVWVNGDQVIARTLAPGDLLEIGRDGPVLRFRLYPPGSGRWKSISEAFADGVDCARRERRTVLGRIAHGIGGVVRELGTRTHIGFRVAVLVVIAVLVALTLFEMRRGRRLEERLVAGALERRELAELLEGSLARPPERGDLERVRAELDSAALRLAALEARTGAPARIVTAAAPSVLLLQGAYGFVEPESGERLRFVRAGTGPTTDPRRPPQVGIGGEGPLVEAFFTGTAFVASRDGLLLTNRHVALPWEYDAPARALVAQGLEPRMSRLLGYLPARVEPIDVRLAATAAGSDVALLWTRERGLPPPLPLAEAPPRPGDEILVLGYPAGIQALLARADDDFVEQVMAARETDFWSVARHLAEQGRIGPLASRGIIAQVSEAAVVYDAETTRGGSGGPVLDLEGRVVGITSAVISEFGGSNLGVPAERARRLLAWTAVERSLPFRLR